MWWSFGRFLGKGNPAILFAVFLAVGIGIIAVPRQIGFYYGLLGDRHLRNLTHGADVREWEINKIRDSRLEELRFSDNPRAWVHLASAEMMLFDHSPSRTDLQWVLSAYTQSLVGAPSNSRAWYMVALIGQVIGQAPERTSQALAMSFKTAPLQPFQMIDRLELSMQIWDSLGPDMRARVRAQIKFACRQSAAQLADITDGQARSRKILLEVLSFFPELHAGCRVSPATPPK